jgi:thiosulfate dehydrogenase
MRFAPRSGVPGLVLAAALVLAGLSPLAGCGSHRSSEEGQAGASGSATAGALASGAGVPLRVPEDSTIPKGPLGKVIERGRRLALATHEELPQNVGNDLHCSSCHLGGGTTAGAAPWVGVPGMFPEYRSRGAKVALLEDRINACFERSMNGKPLPAGSPEMTALVAYMTWLSRDVPIGHPVEGRGFARIATPKVPDRAHGKVVYTEKCVSCHGEDGQGKHADDGSYAFPPLWGDRSFNIGAGMARLDTAAAFVKSKMPLGSGNTLSDQDAYDVADYFTTMPRPDFAGKASDWPQGGKPRDARY